MQLGKNEVQNRKIYLRILESIRKVYETRLVYVGNGRIIEADSSYNNALRLTRFRNDNDGRQLVSQETIPHSHTPHRRRYSLLSSSLKL